MDERGRQEMSEAKRGTWKDHGRASAIIYYGNGKAPAAAGVACVVGETPTGPVGVTIDGKEVFSCGYAGKFWASLDEQAPVNHTHEEVRHYSEDHSEPEATVEVVTCTTARGNEPEIHLPGCKAIGSKRYDRNWTETVRSVEDAAAEFWMDFIDEESMSVEDAMANTTFHSCTGVGTKRYDPKWHSAWDDGKCYCGCGQATKSGRRFVQGHDARKFKWDLDQSISRVLVNAEDRALVRRYLRNKTHFAVAGVRADWAAAAVRERQDGDDGYFQNVPAEHWSFRQPVADLVISEIYETDQYKPE